MRLQARPPRGRRGGADEIRVRSEWDVVSIVGEGEEQGDTVDPQEALLLVVGS